MLQVWRIKRSKLLSLLIFWKTARNMPKLVLKFLKEPFWLDLLEQAKLCLLRHALDKLELPFSMFQVPNSSKCSLVWEPLEFENCSQKQDKKLLQLFLLMKLMRLARKDKPQEMKKKTQHSTNCSSKWMDSQQTKLSLFWLQQIVRMF